MLGWWQVVAADEPQGPPGQPQTLQAEKLIDRGRIISRRRQGAGREPGAAGQRPARLRARLPARAASPRTSWATRPTTQRQDRHRGHLQPLPVGQLRHRAAAPAAQPEGEARAPTSAVSLDTRVQEVAEEALDGKRGAVVAIDPRTGQVHRAWRPTPAFDLQKVVTDFNDDPHRRAARSSTAPRPGLYPPGSTFKVVTATAALDSGAVHARHPFPRHRHVRHPRRADPQLRRRGVRQARPHRRP